jgi:hypothetical protein
MVGEGAGGASVSMDSVGSTSVGVETEGSIVFEVTVSLTSGLPWQADTANSNESNNISEVLFKIPPMPSKKWRV